MRWPSNLSGTVLLFKEGEHAPTVFYGLFILHVGINEIRNFEQHRSRISLSCQLEHHRLKDLKRHLTDFLGISKQAQLFKGWTAPSIG